jgi:hypothetical protein
MHGKKMLADETRRMSHLKKRIARLDSGPL